jgi:hypothetical protein
MQLGGHADILCAVIWSHSSGLMWFCYASDKGTALSFVQISEKSVMETLAVSRQVFGEESMSCIQKFQTHQDQKRRAGEEQSQKHAHNFL